MNHKLYVIFFYCSIFRKGDYTRYKAEIVAPEEVDEVAKASLAAYTKALETATDKLSPTHPTRLGLSLNFSVFHYEIAKNSTEACRIAKEVMVTYVIIDY